jgi:hypothetical protein
MELCLGRRRGAVVTQKWSVSTLTTSSTATEMSSITSDTIIERGASRSVVWRYPPASIDNILSRTIAPSSEVSQVGFVRRRRRRCRDRFGRRRSAQPTSLDAPRRDLSFGTTLRHVSATGCSTCFAPSNDHLVVCPCSCSMAMVSNPSCDRIVEHTSLGALRGTSFGAILCRRSVT